MLMLSSVVQFINTFLQNGTFRVFVLVVTSVFTGYTLYPVPKTLDNMFYVSHVFKYLILMLVLASSMHPLNESSLFLVVVVPVLVLLMFRFLRKYEEKGTLRDALTATMCNK